jgi:hypothetical protein
MREQGKTCKSRSAAPKKISTAEFSVLHGRGQFLFWVPIYLTSPLM